MHLPRLPTLIPSSNLLVNGSISSKKKESRNGIEQVSTSQKNL